MSEKFNEALLRWRKILGDEHVWTDHRTLDHYCRDVTPFEPKASAILLPANTHDVSEILKIANEFYTPVYPISRGRNWGYGATCPFADGQVVVDLRRLNRIHEINEELAYAIIEPGVTQIQLENRLNEINSTLTLDMTAAPPDASVVGNIIERGIGHGPTCDHFANSCNMEIVLANGDITSTGFGHFSGNANANVNKHGLGPSIEGLFSQSNFGIVTRITVWLERKPKTCRAFFFQCSTRDEMVDLLLRFRNLKLAGSLNGNIHIGSPARVNGIVSQSEHQNWSGAGALWGEFREVNAKKRTIDRALNGLQVKWLDSFRLRWVN